MYLNEGFIVEEVGELLYLSEEEKDIKLKEFLKKGLLLVLN